ncbi:MAG: ATP cone domain-containing protein [Cyanobacteriota bacterium]
MKIENLFITKASGEKVPFSYSKLKNSLEKSGSNIETIDYVLEEIKKALYDGITTKKIYKKAYSLLKRSKHNPIAARYKLKQAIMELGPSGFPFERYIAEIFKYKGYNVKIGQMMQGNCVKHEVDVVAENNEKLLFIECKYHKDSGYTCNVKIPLYINSRFMDIEKESRKKPENEKKSFEGWLVTNTKFTTDAIQYGNCVGLHLLGWDYPKSYSLRQLVDDSGLYPLTVLSSLTKNEKQILLEMKVVLCQDLIQNPNFLRDSGIDASKFKNILDECNKLCQE